MKVIKIGAVWCPGCLVMRPRWQKVESQNTWLKTEYHDFDESKDIVQKYDLKDGKLPAFIFLDKNDNEIFRISGELEEKKIIELITKYKDK